MFVYMNVTGITGVGAEPRPDWIWLEDCTFGFERKESSTDGTTESTETKVRAVAKPVSLLKFADRATPSLAAWMSSGEPREVKIEFSLITDLPLVEFTLTGAVLHSYAARFESRGKTTAVMERLSMTYEEIKLVYWQQGATNEDADVADFELKTGA